MPVRHTVGWRNGYGHKATGGYGYGYTLGPVTTHVPHRPPVNHHNPALAYRTRSTHNHIGEQPAAADIDHDVYAVAGLLLLVGLVVGGYFLPFG